MTTPLMGMTLPVAGATEGPSYAELLVAALELVDGHSHAEGSGARITPAAMLVDSDLSFGGFFAASLKAAKFADQSAAFGSGELRAVYSVNGDLYWNNGAGTAVRLTDGTGLNASSIGGIGGDYGSSTANVTYTDSTKVFAFTQSAGIAAKMAVGSVSIFEEISSANSVTLKSASALAGSYDITLFDALPSVNGVVQMSAAGVLDVLSAPGADALLQSTSGGVLSYVTTLPVGFKMTTPKIADSSGGQFYNVAVSDLAADRTVTLPLLTGNDVFVFEAHSQTLTNKTLDAPVFSNTITGTYTLGGTPTINGPTFSGTVLGTYTLGGALTIAGSPSFTGNPIFSHAGGLSTNTISERTSAAGITIDGFKIKDNGPDPSSWPCFDVYKTSTQNILTQFETIITWEAERFDTNSDFASNVFTPSVAGKYLLIISLSVGAMADSAYVIMLLLKNGSVYSLTQVFIDPDSDNQAILTIVAIVDANGTDAFSVATATNIDTNYNINATSPIGGTTRFSGSRIA